MSISDRLKQALLDHYAGSVERVGFILPDDVLIEVQNTSDEPEKSFDVSGDDIVRFADISVATWHTHPVTSSNLSVGDYETFLLWPKHRHFIVGMDGITEYYVEDGEILIA